MIDTAEMYAGDAGVLVGEEIKGHREQVFLVSKIFPQHATVRGTIEACDGSLLRLGVDVIRPWRPPLFAIPKASDPKHVEENAGGGKLRLSKTELARIDAAFPLGPRPRSLPMI